MKARRLDAFDRRKIIALTIMRKPRVTLERVTKRQTFRKSFLRCLPVAD